MRLFEAIVEANQRRNSVSDKAALDVSAVADALPVVALTCIDPRLNHFFPDALGLPEDQFIWLRNAGNIIFDPLSSMTRTLALACAIKGGKEIAIIGHTDCKVGKTSTLDLTERFRRLGIDRTRLPDNLQEFFGLFSSERQNVLKGVDFIRSSPLIGPKIPVHGLLMNVENGHLEWIVNGYQALETATSSFAAARPVEDAFARLGSFNLGEMKFPEFKIGDLPGQGEAVAKPADAPRREELRIGSSTGGTGYASPPTTTPAPGAPASTPLPVEVKPAFAPIGEAHVSDIPKEVKQAASRPLEVSSTRTWAKPEHPAVPDELATVAERVKDKLIDLAANKLNEQFERLELNPVQLFRVIGSDHKTYGPITGAKLLQWVAEERIDWQTPAQLIGQSEWKPLKEFVVKGAKGKSGPPPVPSGDARWK
jgi:carbonic anhydrase